MLINIILCSSLLILLPFFAITKALSTHFITLYIIITVNIVNRNFLHKNPRKHNNTLRLYIPNIYVVRVQWNTLQLIYFHRHHLKETAATLITFHLVIDVIEC